MKKSLLVLVAGLLGVIGIAARAFEAHGLGALADMSQPRMTDFSSGTEMVLLHAPVFLGLAAIADLMPRASLLASIALIAGIILFAVPLFAYGLADTRALILLTPVGGIALMLGWVALAIGGALGLTRSARS